MRDQSQGTEVRLWPCSDPGHVYVPQFLPPPENGSPESVDLLVVERREQAWQTIGAYSVLVLHSL